MEYKHIEIEKKWQSYWDKNQTFAVEEKTNKPKYYCLDMFPYPSGDGLHVGHPEGYTATDIVSRYKRMNGYNVLHPMGWDSFGLPAENHAMKTNIHPKITTEKNIKNFKRQLQSLGLSYDWNREIQTSQINYYHWTQWIFIQLYNKGLAYEKEVSVNWCPELKTILANEEVIDGKSAIGNHPVVRRPMKQWMLKITEYADRLLNDLDELDWPNSVKEMQKTWIGKSFGALIHFPIKDNDHETIEVYTTRADTIFGATFMVISPEHPSVENLTVTSQKDEMSKYQNEASKKSDLERTDLAKDKTGVFTGSYCINPFTKKEVPIWVSDYVLMDYGTGAIMAVPAHDERDNEYAKKYKLEIIPVTEGEDEIHFNSDFMDGLNKQDALKAVHQRIEELGIGKRKTNYKLRDWLFSRQRYWGEPIPVLKYEDGSIRCLDVDELPLELPDLEEFRPSGTGESPLANAEQWLNVTCSKTGKKARRETHTMPQWAGSCWYYLRYMDPKNSKQPFSESSQSYWLPVDLYIGGAEHAVLHLLYSRFWHKVLFDLGLVKTKEPFLKLVNQGMILGTDGEKMSKSRGNVINPDDIVQNFGADTLRLYEMFMGPLEKTKPWSTSGVKGVYNFLNKAFKFFSDSSNIIDSTNENPNVLKELHKTIAKVTHDIEKLKFNTCISQLMIFTNTCINEKKVTRNTAKTFALLLSPLAPHMGEEIWEFLGAKNSLAYEIWPTYDPELIKEDNVIFAVQINGKTRGTIECPVGSTKETVISLAKDDNKLGKYFKNQEVIKEIFIPNKILNVIVKK